MVVWTELTIERSISSHPLRHLLLLTKNCLLLAQRVLEFIHLGFCLIIREMGSSTPATFSFRLLLLLLLVVRLWLMARAGATKDNKRPNSWSAGLFLLSIT